MPIIKKLDFYAMSQVEGTEQGEERFTIHLLVNSKKVPLYVSLPAEGGVRIYTDQEGVFKPDFNQKLKYETDSQGNVKVCAEDQSYLILKQQKNDWEMEIGNTDTALVVLKGSELALGFQGEEIQGVRFAAPLEKEEAIYGTGERYNAINQVGNKIQLWNLDTAYHIADGDFSTKVESYNNVPFIHSTKGYSFFFNNSYCIDADFGVADAAKYTLEAQGPKFDFYFWTKSPLENIASYTQLTGRAFVPPKWAFSYWAGAGSSIWRGSDNGKGEYISILQNFIKGYKKLGIDLSVLYGEYPLTTDKVAYSMLKKDNITMLMWNPCYLDYDKIIDSIKVLDTEAPVVRSTLNSWRPSVLDKNTAFIDYTHENAKKFVISQYKQCVDWGMRGLMVDMGEKINPDTIFSNGMTGDEMHNLYAYYYAKTINEAFQEMRNGKEDFVLFERSGYAGSQAYAASFTGDQTSKIYGLKQQLNGGLSMSTSGFTIWGGDIGGYYGTPTADTYIRWLEFSTFQPLMREHGVGKNSSNPWEFGATAESVFKNFYWLRENIVDTVYSSAVNSGKYGSLVTAPLIALYPEETALQAVEDEYIFCDNLLVCPVTENDVTSREVTLPSGTWYDLWNGAALEGGQTFVAKAPQSNIPVYLKAGALMPVTVADTFALTDVFDEDTARKAIVVTPTEKETTFEAWDDEGKNSVVYTNQPVSKDTYCITANGEAADHILAYGTLAKSVKVDGVYLPRIESTDKNQIGYYIDGHDKTVIILPDGEWDKVEISTQSISISDLDVSETAIFTDNKNEEETGILKTLHNEDDSKVWVASTAKNTYLQAELEKEYKIDSVSLRWGQGFAASFDIEVSTDGENFETVCEVAERSGGQDVINFAPVKAKYVRITNIKKGTEYPASVYNMAIYKTPNIKKASSNTIMYFLSTFAKTISGGDMTLFFITVVSTAVTIGVVVTGIVLQVRKRRKRKEVTR